MSDYNWCHGPECHEQQTQSRVRGSGDNKVLRTIKIKVDSEYIRQSIFSHFCNQRCLMDYLKLHKDRVVALAPRTKALETPIKVEKEKYESHRYEYNGNYNNARRVPYMATRTTIKSVDNDNG
tara:strand:- start:408 stop:776 length:369 start_codon:yes stop_codon:yes gene_type:complete